MSGARGAVLAAALVLLAGAAAAQDGDGAGAAGEDAPPPPLVWDGTARAAFGLQRTPSGGRPTVVGGYSRGCVAGAAQLPLDGPSWQAMRPSRGRSYGHPALVSFVEDLAASARRLGMSGILVGDMSQPRGGPMPSGHSSHQIGLDVDIWLAGMPARRLSPAERDAVPFVSALTADGTAVDPRRFDTTMQGLVRAAARDGRVARIFVHPLLKRALCASAGADRTWLRKVRPWYGHHEHFHVRLACPPGQAACKAQRPPPPGDGCGADLAYWFTPAPYRSYTPPGPPLPLAAMPPACIALARPPAASPPGVPPLPSAYAPAEGTGQLTPVPPSPQ